MDEKTPILKTKRPSSRDELLRNKFDEELIEQSIRLDELAKLLITIELAVPGVYAAALKLLSGKDAVLSLGFAVYAAFFLWAVALILTLTCLLPRPMNVDRNKIEHSPDADKSKPMAIETFYQRAAKRKYRLLVIACLCFFLGVSAAAFSVL